MGCTGAFCENIWPLTVALSSTKTIVCPASLYCLIIEKHISLPVLVSCLQSSLARGLNAKNQVSQSAKGAQPVHWMGWLHPVRPFSFFQPQQTDQSSFLHQHPSASRVLKLVRAGKEARIRLVHISPQTQQGELPSRSNHRHMGEVPYDTRNTVNQLHTHTHREKKQKKQTFILPFCRENILYGTLYKSKSCLFYNLLHCC